MNNNLSFKAGLFFDLENYFAATADFNGDGILDLAVANYDTPYGSDVLSTVSILLGNGDGTFTDDVQYTVGDGAKEIGVGDFNGDGVADLAVANVFSNFVSVLIGVGDGTFNSTNNIATNTGVKAVSVDDLDGDGIADLVIADRNDEIIILNGEGNGNFTPGESFSSGAFDLNTLTTADLSSTKIQTIISSFLLPPSFQICLLHQVSKSLTLVIFSPG